MSSFVFLRQTVGVVEIGSNFRGRRPRIGDGDRRSAGTPDVFAVLGRSIFIPHGTVMFAGMDHLSAEIAEHPTLCDFYVFVHFC